MILYWCSLAALAWIGLRDWHQRRITNTSLMLVAVLGAIYTTLPGALDWQQVIVNALVGVALTLPGYMRGAVGGGDVKLMVAVSPLWPPLALLFIFAVGIAVTVTLLYASGFARKREYEAGRGMCLAPGTDTAADSASPSPHSKLDNGLPLGAAIALGTAVLHGFQLLRPDLSLTVLNFAV